MCDELRWDALGYSSNGYVKTPHIDKIASSGINFENAYCASPICSPARASWFTGLYPHAHHQYRNYTPAKRNTPGCLLNHDSVTISDILNEKDYDCANIGVWHLGDDEKPQHGFESGWCTYRYLKNDVPDPLFDYFKNEKIDNLYSNDTSKHSEKSNITSYGINTLAFGTINDPRQQRTTWTINNAINFLDRKKESNNPFFLMCGIKDPHPLMLVPPKFLKLYPETEVPLPTTRHDELLGKPDFQQKGKFRIPPGTLSDTQYSKMIAYYYALVSHIDEQVGRLHNYLETNNLIDNTIFVFSSDHGELLGDHGFVEKWLMYESSVRVPCIISWPKNLSAQVVKSPLGGVDLMPTLLELAGIATPNNIDGRSVASALLNSKEPNNEPIMAEIASQEAIYQDDNDPERLAEHVMLKDGVWKLILNRNDINELYKLDTDPEEMNNLATLNEHSERVQIMRSIIAKKLNKTGPGLYSWCL